MWCQTLTNLLLLIALLPRLAHAQQGTLADCRAERTGDTLRLSTGRIERVFRWNEGHLIGTRLTNKTTGHSWNLAARQPDVSLPDSPTVGQGSTLVVTPQAATPSAPAHLLAEVTTTLGTLQLRRVFRLYPDCPAIAADLYLRGTPGSSWPTAPAAALSDLRNIESRPTLPDAVAEQTVLDRLLLPGTHWRMKAVEFFDVTDHQNNLVRETAIVPYRSWSPLTGNLLFAEQTLTGNGLFMLKEAPTSAVQLAYPGHDFVARIGEVKAVGLGLAAGDIRSDGWTKGYSVVVGVTAGDETNQLLALRAYQKNGRINLTGRDEMILMNTWGDRGQDTRVNEAFALNELKAGQRLGITHFQLDDGWQAGRSSNSAFQGGSLTQIWNNPRYWTPHPDRFPGGLGPVVAAGRAAGIEVCLWFNPSADSSYAHWRQDADALIRLYQAYGIRTFKIDGVKIPDKTAELNLRRLFDAVMTATGQQAVFNLDVTAGRRFGYHYFAEYGNVFLENRYTDWTNYYPHWTLRNLWLLSRYVPAQRLQIEFLNKWRNPERYPLDDSLAPAHYPFAYLFAITMMAQPLAWFEGTRLPEEAFSVAPLLARYRQLQPALHAGAILPIGEEPSGQSWTGFQSVQPGGSSGYVLVFRERHPAAKITLTLRNLPPGLYRFSPVLGAGKPFQQPIGVINHVRFSLPRELSFALYRYKRLGSTSHK